MKLAKKRRGILCKLLISRQAFLVRADDKGMHEVTQQHTCWSGDAAKTSIMSPCDFHSSFKHLQCHLQQ